MLNLKQQINDRQKWLVNVKGSIKSLEIYCSKANRKQDHMQELGKWSENIRNIKQEEQYNMS